MCESLVDLGHRVILALGRKFWRRAQRERDWTEYYGFNPRFEVARVWELPRIGWGFDGRILRMAMRHDALLYLRFPRLLARREASQVPTVLEVHSALSIAERRCVAQALAQGSLLGVVVITAALRDELLKTVELQSFADRLLVAPDAVNCKRFAHVLPTLDLDQVGYVGSLYPGKGMEQIDRIAALRRELSFHVFGGSRAQLASWQKRLASRTNLTLWGHIPPAQIPACFGRFGIALLPNQPSVRLPNGEDIGRFTSPMKLFEYMAAGRAIVASDLPGLREILRHNVNCLLVRHDDPAHWAAAIDQLRDNPEQARRLAMQAKYEAEHWYSYTHRFRTILDHFLATAPGRRST
jgi:glycosyltransferase involved in cell wall biosynthesis